MADRCGGQWIAAIRASGGWDDGGPGGNHQRLSLSVEHRARRGAYQQSQTDQKSRIRAGKAAPSPRSHTRSELSSRRRTRAARAHSAFTGYAGEPRFRSAQTPRSGQQAALGKDLLDFMDALSLPRATLVGYDWGGRAACIVAALWPERAKCLVSQNGYNIQDISAAAEPLPPEQEYRYWYQYYFNTERGRAGLTQNRRALARLLWRLWSPNWQFDDATFERTAKSFDNPDFVDVAIQSYRHRY